MPSGKQHSDSHSRASSWLADPIQTRLDLQELDKAVKFYFQSGIAASTQKAYNSVKKRYIMFCSDKGPIPLPATENQLCLYVSTLADQKLCHSTIKSYLAAIRHLHIAQDFGDPHLNRMAKLEQVLKDIKSIQCREPAKRVSCLPILPIHLRKMREVWKGMPPLFEVRCCGRQQPCVSSVFSIQVK